MKDIKEYQPSCNKYIYIYIYILNTKVKAVLPANEKEFIRNTIVMKITEFKCCNL